jgi:spore germination protein
MDIMYKRLAAFLFPVLALALVGSGLWGYQVNQEKNTVLIKAENQYQRAFHDLSFHVEQLHSELGQALAVHSGSDHSQRKSLANVWRMTSEAQNEINQLPLTLLPFNKTEEFLSNVAKFSYQVAVRDMSKQPLSEDETKTLTTLYNHSKEISKELRDVQSKVIANNLRWMDVEMALASQNETQDNTIIDGFKTVDKSVGEYEEINWGPSVSSVFSKQNMQVLEAEPEATEEEIRKKAAEFLGGVDAGSLNIVENGQGKEYNSYSVSAQMGDHHTAQLDFTKKGGHLIWFINERMISEGSLTIEQAVKSAQEFLTAHGYNDMVPISKDEYLQTASITFATSKDGVIIYPEKLAVQVALDNGEVMGLHAKDYVYRKKDREVKAPSLTPEQAKKKLNPNLEVSSEQRALITNDAGEDVICYMYVGRINGSQYRIYINGDTGQEEKIEQIRESDATAGQ